MINKIFKQTKLHKWGFFCNRLLMKISERVIDKFVLKNRTKSYYYFDKLKG